MGTNIELIRQAGAFQTAHDADALAALFKEDAVFEPRIRRQGFRSGSAMAALGHGNTGSRSDRLIDQLQSLSSAVALVSQINPIRGFRISGSKHSALVLPAYQRSAVGLSSRRMSIGHAHDPRLRQLALHLSILDFALLCRGFSV